MDKKQGIKARAASRRGEVYTGENLQVQVDRNQKFNNVDYSNKAHDIREISVEPQEVKQDVYEASRKISTNKTPRRKRQGGKLIAVLLLLAILLGIIGTTIYIEKFGLSKVEMNLSEYYGSVKADEMVVILNNEIQEEHAIEKEGMQYLPYDLVNDKINEKIYWDYSEKLLLYTYSDYTQTIALGDQTSGYEYAISFETEDTLYISLEYIQSHTDVMYEVYNNPDRIVIQSAWDVQQVVTAKKSTQIRYRGGVKSEILTYVEKGDELVYREDYGDWIEVASKDGFIGYVQSSKLTNPTTTQSIRTFEEEVYTNIKVDYDVNLAWHQTTNFTSNNGINALLESSKGLTTIAPTWFFIDDTQGSIKSLASQDYVDYAHNKGLDVWATLNDFDGAIGSQSETYEVLRKTSTRKKIIDKVINEVIEYNIDGINVDIELVNTSSGNHFIQFIRELSVECRANGIVLSVDNYPPKIFNQHYEYEEQGEVADYIIIMGYDEYYSGSKEAGPVSSITYVEDGIKDMLEMVPAEKVINAVPFYSRLFAEIPKTSQELLAQQGTEEGEYLNHVSSISMSMDGAYQRAVESGASITWDDITKHNYATWNEGEKTYKIWLEDVKSLEEKLKVMKQYNLAGVAAWKLGLEQTEVWDVIKSYY